MKQIKLVDKTCEGCDYLMHAVGFGKTAGCEYVGVTGKQRPCPPGKGCKVKDTGRKKPVHISIKD